MNRERAFVVLPFSVWDFGEVVELGKVGNAGWRIIAHPQKVRFSRSGSCAERVRFDIVMVSFSYGTASREFKTTEYMNVHEFEKFVSFGDILPFCAGSGYQGNIKVYFNSGHTVDGSPSLSDDDPSVEKGFVPPPPVSHDLLHLLDSPDSYSDATLKCGELTIPVHKCILSTRSSVFEAMFKNENQNDEWEIDDMDPDVFRDLLRQVYIGHNDQLTDEMAVNLLPGSVRFELQDLKSACIDRLKHNMSPSNVFSILILGDMHDTSLKESSIDFLCTHNLFLELEKYEDWKKLQKDHSLLALDVLSCCVKYMQDKWCRPAGLVTMEQSEWFMDPVEALADPEGGTGGM